MCILAYIISVTVLLEEFLVRPVQIFAVVSRLQTEEFFNISNQDLISHNMSSDLSAVTQHIKTLRVDSLVVCVHHISKGMNRYNVPGSS